jgi:hypothetical protein
MSHQPLRLYAYIPGRDGGPFPVSIDPTRTVGELKKMIVAENPKTLVDLEPRHLILYKVEIHDDGNLEKLKNEVLQTGPAGIVELKAASAKLSRSFPEIPPEQTINIIVRIPGDGE